MMVTMIPTTIITGTGTERDVDLGTSFSGAFSACKANEYVIIRLSLTTNLTFGDIQNKGITVSSTIVS